MLKLTNIQKSFNNNIVFSIKELHLPIGIYWLKGVNGSGKSTLLNIIAGLTPFEGKIVLNENININKQPVTYRRFINHAEAEPVYPSFLSGYELIEFVIAIKKGTAKQLNEIRGNLSIDNYLTNPTGSYSSGMLKKLSLVMAFTGQPLWILLDEPFTTLNQASQKLCVK
jgi:ABC-2 type transport system ATP-binding protein